MCPFILDIGILGGISIFLRFLRSNGSSFINRFFNLPFSSSSSSDLASERNGISDEDVVFLPVFVSRCRSFDASWFAEIDAGTGAPTPNLNLHDDHSSMILYCVHTYLGGRRSCSRNICSVSVVLECDRAAWPVCIHEVTRL